MKKIFWGFILIFFDFILQIGNLSVGVLPDFVGYFLIVSGLRKMPDDIYEFQKIRVMTMIAALLSTVVYFLDLVGLSAKLGYIATVVELCFTIFALYISYTIIVGIREIEKKNQVDLFAKKLRINWILLVVAQLIIYITIFLPQFFLICMVASIAFTISFIMTFRSCKRSYYYIFEM